MKQIRELDKSTLANPYKGSRHPQDVRELFCYNDLRTKIKLRLVYHRM
jgi:hypothetical protein